MLVASKANCLRKYGMWVMILKPLDQLVCMIVYTAISHKGVEVWSWFARD